MAHPCRKHPVDSSAAATPQDRCCENRYTGNKKKNFFVVFRVMACDSSILVYTFLEDAHKSSKKSKENAFS